MSSGRNKQNERTAIPLCQSSFLRDVTIAVGRRRKALRYKTHSLRFNRGLETTKDGSFERLTIDAKSYSGDLRKIVVWDDRIAWICIRQGKQSTGKSKRFERHVSLAQLTIAEIGELFERSLTMNGAEEEWRHLPGVFNEA